MANSGWPTYTLGQAGDIPVPGDYDGDGIIQPAVFRPGNTTWYIHGQPSGVYGEPNSIPVPADYDGDGFADMAVFRPSTGTWIICKVKGCPTTTFGQAGDLPVPADYDGNGSLGLAVFRPSNATWYFSQPATSRSGKPGTFRPPNARPILPIPTNGENRSKPDHVIPSDHEEFPVCHLANWRKRDFSLWSK